MPLLFWLLIPWWLLLSLLRLVFYQLLRFSDFFYNVTDTKLTYNRREVLKMNNLMLSDKCIPSKPSPQSRQETYPSPPKVLGMHLSNPPTCAPAAPSPEHHWSAFSQYRLTYIFQTIIEVQLYDTHFRVWLLFCIVMILRLLHVPVSKSGSLLFPPPSSIHWWLYHNLCIHPVNFSICAAEACTSTS